MAVTILSCFIERLHGEWGRSLTFL
jgi:hypothetical protein